MLMTFGKLFYTGTTNFVHGMPLCMPSIAVAYKGEVVVGAIYDCHRDEMFTAMKGQVRIERCDSIANYTCNNKKRYNACSNGPHL